MVGFVADDDIETMLADTGHILTFDGLTRPCEFHEYDDVELQLEGAVGQVVHRAKASVKTSDFPGIKIEDAVTITLLGAEPVDYAVWDRRLRGDGLTDLWLKVS